MLGSNLMIANLTAFDQIIELSVDSNSYKYNIAEIIRSYPDSNSHDLDTIPFNI